MKPANKGRLLGAHCSTAGGLPRAPLLAAELGATALQLFTGSNVRWDASPLSEDDVEAFRRFISECGIRAVMAHACYLINLAAPDAAIWRRSIGAMQQELARADELAIPFVVVHPGSHRDHGLAWGVERIARALDRILAATEGLKASIALETTAGQGSSIGHTFEELAAILSRVDQKDRVGICLDTCHIFAAGYELRTKEGYRRTWASFEAALGLRKLWAIHLNDSKGERASRVDRHAHIGEGAIGAVGFRLLMNDPHLAAIPMVLETPKEGDALASDRRNLDRLLRMIRAR
jgi:deoxyribonuclease IV